MKFILCLFIYLPLIVYSQKVPGDSKPGPTNPPSGPPIAYIADYDFFINRSSSIFLHTTNSLDKWFLRKEYF